MGLSYELMKLTIIAMTFGAAMTLAYTVLKARTEGATIKSRLDETLLRSSAARGTRAAAMQSPFALRVTMPALKKIVGVFLRFAPAGFADATRRRLVLAGLGDKLTAEGFYARGLALPIGAFLTLMLLNRAGDGLPLFAWLAVPLVAALPKLWLSGRIDSRQKAIRRALPDTLDMLTIAVEAGLGFDAALARVVAGNDGPLSDELYRMLQEIKIGIPRRQVLKRLNERTDTQELHEFITAINQADQFGIAVGKVLRVQAEQLRQKRTQAAEERAAKTPVKLLFPLLFCIFPALFVVLVGPAAIQISKTLFGAL
ncbi:MAG: type II secretion system F family protein [Actinomycetota bacterium]